MDYFKKVFEDEDGDKIRSIEVKNWKEKPALKLSKLIENLGRVGCDLELAAGILGLSNKEWISVLTECPELNVSYARGCAQMKVDLSAKQYQRAMQGSDAMLKHLGKHKLGQVDKLEINVGLAPDKRKAMLEDVERKHKERMTSLTSPDVVEAEYVELAVSESDSGLAAVPSAGHERSDS